MNLGLLVLAGLLVGLIVVGARKGIAFDPVFQRFAEQFAKLVPRMLCALLAAGFIAELIPKELISSRLGDDAGLMALPIAAITGLQIPAGPVIAFAIAAVFAGSGASKAALITFITSWSLFAAHRILIYEIPLLGSSFLRLRCLSVIVIPFVAGILALAAGFLVVVGEAAPVQ